MSPKQRRPAAILMMSLTLVLGACAKTSTPVSSGENTSLVPFELLADWKSYGDLVAVVRIDAEDKRKDPQQSPGLFMHTGTGIEEMTSSSTFSLDGEKLVADQPQALVNRPLNGLTVDQLDKRLKATEPDPIAEKFADLPPRLRWEEVRKAHEVEAGPTTTDH